MKILFLDNEFPPLGGGTGVINEQLFKQFAQYPEIEIDLVTSSRTKDVYEKEEFAKNITIHKVPVNNKNIHHSTAPELLKYAYRGLRYSQELHALKKFDFSFAFAGVPAGGISYALKFQKDLPYILSLQGPDIPGFEARYKFLYPVLKPVLKKIWTNAEIVLTQSEHQEYLASKFIPDFVMQRIPNGVDTETFNAEHKNYDTVNIICAARLIRRKGQNHLIEVCAELKRDLKNVKFRLSLVGTGDDENFLKQLANELSVSSEINFLGYVSRENMPNTYREASIFVLPSQNEGMSVALLEALASGLPAIVTKVGGTSELVRDDENGFTFDFGNKTALRQHLETLVKDSSLRKAFGLRSRAIAEEFSWKIVAEKHMEVFANTLQKLNKR